MVIQVFINHHSHPSPHHWYTPHNTQKNPRIHCPKTRWYSPLGSCSKIATFTDTLRFGTCCRSNLVTCLFIRNPRLVCTWRGLLPQRWGIPAFFTPKRRLLSWRVRWCLGWSLALPVLNHKRLNRPWWLLWRTPSGVKEAHWRRADPWWSHKKA